MQTLSLATINQQDHECDKTLNRQEDMDRWCKSQSGSAQSPVDTLEECGHDTGPLHTHPIPYFFV